jgi:hypothetical protein
VTSAGVPPDVAIHGHEKVRSAGNGACVEVATARRHVLVRDSKDQDGPVVQYPSGAWQTFLANARKGQFDL